MSPSLLFNCAWYNDDNFWPIHQQNTYFETVMFYTIRGSKGPTSRKNNCWNHRPHNIRNQRIRRIIAVTSETAHTTSTFFWGQTFECSTWTELHIFWGQFLKFISFFQLINKNFHHFNT